ncbi:MAG: GatB/YqeY domain-containing protein [Pseudomonadota bacterium]
MRERLAAATKEAEGGGDSTRLSTLRLINAAIRDRDIALRAEQRPGESASRASDATVLHLLFTMIKQREESARSYEESGKLDLADRERAELAVIREFLPEPLSDAEAKEAVRRAVAEIGADDLRDLGRVMTRLKQAYAGRMDFTSACETVREALGAAVARSR